MQIQLTEVQHQAVKRLAATRGVSASAVVREGVEVALSRATMPKRGELKRKALAAIGRFRSGTGDVAARHDEIFAEAASVDPGVAAARDPLLDPR